MASLPLGRGPPMAEPCGCIIDNIATRANPNHVIIHCPMHTAAKDTLVALEKYGFHTKVCPASLQPFNGTPCDCGWWTAASKLGISLRNVAPQA